MMSVDRAFEVLELLAGKGQPMRAIEIGRALAIPQSSSIVLLKCMAELGYLVFDRVNRNYYPTMRLASLGRHAARPFGIKVDLLGLMDEITARTGETCTISCQNDLEMQFLAVSRTTKPAVYITKAGTRAPLFRSAIGLVALSHRPAPVVAKLVEQFDRRHRHSPHRAAIRTVLERLDHVRANGFAVGYDLYLEGAGAIAWALPAFSVQQPLVIAVGGPSDRMRLQESNVIRKVQPLIDALNDPSVRVQSAALTDWPTAPSLQFAP